MSCCIIDLSFLKKLCNKQAVKIMLSALSGCSLIGDHYFKS